MNEEQKAFAAKLPPPAPVGEELLRALVLRHTAQATIENPADHEFTVRVPAHLLDEISAYCHDNMDLVWSASNSVTFVANVA